MSALSLTADDYRTALLALLPAGAVWPRDPASVMARLAAGLAETPARLDDRARALLVDAFPRVPLELLPEWEATLDLPDRCTRPGRTIEQRQAAVAARFVGRGGQSAAYYISVAAALGVEITVTNFTPAKVGTAAIGDPLRGTKWAHAWQINAPINPLTYARAGSARVGDRLVAWNNDTLECTIKRIAPAHTVPIFTYS